MLRRIPQPPVNPALRDPERHEFWPGLVVALVGLVLAFGGARRLTNIPTVDGDTARETQLIRAFAFGGLRYPELSTQPPPPPMRTGDPIADAQALDRWVKEKNSGRPGPAPDWKVRVDTGAKTPCPT